MGAVGSALAGAGAQPLSEKSFRIAALPEGPEHTPQSAVHHIPFPLVGGGLLPLLCQPALEADFARAMGHRAVACNTGNAGKREGVGRGHCYGEQIWQILGRLRTVDPARDVILTGTALW